MRINREAIGIGLSVALLAEALGGCDASSKKEDPNFAPVKPVAAAGATPQPSPTTITTTRSTLLDHPTIVDNNGERIWILYGSTAPEAELDKFDAENILRWVFRPEFLERDNIAENIKLYPKESRELQLGENGSRTRRWQTTKSPDSKITAQVEATFQVGSLITATVTGQLKDIFPWKEKLVPVETGKAEQVVEKIEEVFDLAGSREAVHIFDKRVYPGIRSGVYDLVIGVSGDRTLSDGSFGSLWISPDGSFRYSIEPSKKN